jgi:L-amino acid N-acyltransferase YncA
MSEADKKHVDWELIEKDYRAGIKTLRQIADERGVSHVAIAKRAKKFGWVRDLSEKIQAKAKEKVTRLAVNKSVNTEQALTDAKVVEVYSDVVASVDMIQREDVKMAIDNSRSQLGELVALGDPEFRDKLVALGEAFDESGPTANGGWKTDKNNELYQYIISLAGRVKMAKEIAASHGVYLPLQRKIFGLDAEKKSAGEFEEMLRRVQLTED